MRPLSLPSESRLNHPLFGRAYLVHVNKDGTVHHDPYLDCTQAFDASIHISIGDDLKMPIVLHCEALVPLTITVKKNASVHIIAQFDGILQTVIPTVTSLTIEQNAQCFWYRLAEIASNGNAHHKCRAHIAKNGFLSTHCLNLSTGNYTEDLAIELLGPGAVVDFYLLDLMCHSARMDTNLTITHHAHESESKQLVRTIYADRAQGKFLGKVIVDKSAAKSAARQHYKTLLLGKDAKASVLPQLEINNYDISASHGATVGELDPEALFYLQSRGIDLVIAKTLLVSALTSEITATISQPHISDFIAEKVKNALSEVCSGSL